MTGINKTLALAGLTCLTLPLLSCDPAIMVTLQNTTSKPRYITVIYPPRFTFPCDTNQWIGHGMLCDSVRTYKLTTDSTMSNAVSVPREAWDKVNRSYSFWLQPQYEAIVEARSQSSRPTFGQRFIIDHTDTIELNEKSKDFTKSPKMILGGKWSYRIK